MSWAVVYTEKNDVNKREYLETFAYSKENAIELANKYNKNATDKEYRIEYCETF